MSMIYGFLDFEMQCGLKLIVLVLGEAVVSMGNYVLAG